MDSSESYTLRKTARTLFWDSYRSQNKYTNCKGVKNNTKFGQITGIQGKVDTTCKSNASQ